MVGIRIEGTDDLQRVADALKDAGDKDLQKRVSGAIRTEAKPLGIRVLRRAAPEYPSKGGLSARIEGMGKVGVSSALRGRIASVTVILRNKGVDLKALDAGILRHPVFGNRGVWVRQNVRSGAFSWAFEAESREVAGKVNKAAQDSLDAVARKA